jgi:hypothetical protein
VAELADIRTLRDARSVGAAADRFADGALVPESMHI